MRPKEFISTSVIISSVLALYFYAHNAAPPSENRDDQPIEKLTPFDPLVARDKIRPYFEQANLKYPPEKVTLLAMKEEGTLEVWASDSKDEIYKYIRSYNIQKLSGMKGPKLREGDKQVPEGIYKLVLLNPNSAYHLSMKINYPNEFDLIQANNENRDEPGTNIFIHGKAVSVGCLAMGDHTIESLYILSKDVGVENVKVLIAPHDPRERKLDHYAKTQPKWMEELYQNIEKSYQPYQNKN